jgi:hypothetical protein
MGQSTLTDERLSDSTDSTDRRVQRGDVVSYRFRIRADSGQVLAVGAEVVHYLHGGNGTDPPALASLMTGRCDGETFRASLPEEVWRTLHFEISIVSIRLGTDEERKSGAPAGKSEVSCQPIAI